MYLNEIVSILTIVITWILGYLAKRYNWINKHLIPLENLFIGVSVAIIEYIITKDFSTSIALSGLIAGGTYDIVHNLQKIKEGFN